MKIVLGGVCWLLGVLWGGAAWASEPLPVVASFSVLGDLVQRVGGTRVRVSVLVGRNADAHVYQPSPADARALADARLVFINGLGFEGWIERLVKSSGYRGPVVVASKGAKLLRLSAAHRHGDRHDHAHDAADPHAWLDPANALIYVSNIERALTQVDPAGAAHYRESAAQLSGEIRALDGQIRAMLEPVPAARRMVVSSHESFAYFGRAYGIRFRAPLGLSTEAGAAAADVGALIRQIRREKIPAIFLEKITDPRLLEQVRRETGAVIGGMLYSDALSEPGGNAPDYLAMMRHNAQALATALTR